MESANSSKQELAIRSKKAVYEVLRQFPNRVIVSKDFRNVLTTVKEMDSVTHPIQVFNAFRDYIFSKGLLDINDPLKVNCKNDQLGAILGMNEFTLADVAKILLKFVFPANSGVCSSHNDDCKRKGEEIIAEVKKFKNVTDDIHISLSSSANDPSSSAGSAGSGETSLSQNFADYFSCSSSDEKYSIVAVEETFDIEYEVESDSSLSVGSASTFSDSDSEIMDTLNAAIIEVICKSDSDMEFWADNSSDDETYSSLESVKSGCSSCAELNIFSNSLCSACFHKRMELIALEKTRPKRKFRSKRKRTRASAKINQEGATNTSQNDVLECVPSTSSQESFVSEFTDSQLHSDLSQVRKVCFLCCDRPANGTIVHAHSKFAHTISCYTCAKRLQREKKRCPICRRKIDRVVCSV